MANARPSDALDALRTEFTFPTNAGVGATDLDPSLANEPCVYLCGNSLGLPAKRSEALVKEQLDVWGTRAVIGHFEHPHGRDWMNIADHANPLVAEIIGAKPSEVATMGTLTANLHLMMNTFYKPTPARSKILCEAHAFPSDQYAFASQASRHGFDPAATVIELAPRAGEFTLREEDILAAIEQHGPEIAVVLFSGLQYYTGQLFPMANIAKKARQAGCVVGFDLAHAVGNVPLALHDWDVDFAVWCTYKYLNSGPGGIGGLFIHERWEKEVSSYAGWWGHDPKTRFQMPPTFAPIPGAQGFQQSNPSALTVASLLGSLEIFKKAGMIPALRARSERLTALLYTLLSSSKHYMPLSAVSALPPAHTGFTIITPDEPAARGAQLSLLFLPTGSGLMQRTFDGIQRLGVIGDERRPDVIRLAPAPIYNDEQDVRKAVAALDQVLDHLAVADKH